MKLYNLAAILTFLFLSTGCGKEAPPIDRERIVNILMDVHIAEGLINGHHPSIMKDSLQKRYLNQILEKWNTTEPEFEAALNHMNGDPNYMREVYEAVQDQVNKYSEELDEAESRQLDLEKEKQEVEKEDG